MFDGLHNDENDDEDEECVLICFVGRTIPLGIGIDPTYGK